ncbi:hypothetical protein [Obesumbacterium proteus]|nr:hypothetical protein [Obesumbacterium proteus]AMO81134.1 hypothetical protein DSM2777_08820 [Obesumbacterium proteus]
MATQLKMIMYICNVLPPNKLKRMKTELGPRLGVNVKLVQLISYTDWNETKDKKRGQWINYNNDLMMKPDSIKEISQYADAISPDYHMLLNNKDGKPQCRLQV